MNCSLQKGSFRGATITTPWSSTVTVKEVLVTVEISGWNFYGVVVENRDRLFWDWLDSECLIWAFDDGQGLRMWQDSHHQPLINAEQPVNEIEKIIGHHQSTTGDCYIAVKWKDRLSPTWESEQDLNSCADILTGYFMRYPTLDLYLDL